MRVGGIPFDLFVLLPQIVDELSIQFDLIVELDNGG